MKNPRALVVLGLVFTGSVLVASREGYAGIFDCFRRPATTTYSPVVVAAPSPCAPCATGACAPATVVQYAPQVCYRPVAVTTPVTTFMSVTTCKPCGGATTVLRPVISQVQTVQSVPFVSYRPVCTSGCAPAVATTTFYAPATTTLSVPTTYTTPATPVYTAPAGCSTCGTQTVGYAPLAAAAPRTYVPPYAPPAQAASVPVQVSYPSVPPSAGAVAQPYEQNSYPSPSTQAPPYNPNATLSPIPAAENGGTPHSPATGGSSSQPSQPTPTPALNGANSSASPSDADSVPNQQVPEVKNGSARGLFRLRPPALRDPEDQTASRGSTFRVIPAVHSEPAPRTQEEADADGWRSARK